MPREDLAEQESRRWAEIIELAINLEQAGDIIEHMLGKVQNLKISKRRSFSDSGLDELGQLHNLLSANLSLGLSVFLSGDSHSARQLLQQKRQFRKRERELAHAHVHRLHQQVVESIETSAAHLELIADMKRLNSLFCSAAYPALEGSGSGKPRVSGESQAVRETRIKQQLPPGKPA
jgi:phosphate:Na+ symporter